MHKPYFSAEILSIFMEMFFSLNPNIRLYLPTKPELSIWLLEKCQAFCFLIYKILWVEICSALEGDLVIITIHW